MTRRLFVAIDIPPEVRSALVAAQTFLTEGGSGSGVRWQRPELAHLTLLFLGPVADSDLSFCRSAVAKTARSHGPVDLETTTLGAFPSKARPSVLWLGVGDSGEHQALQHLHRSLAEGLAPVNRQRERQTFRPHLTLGRIKRPSPDRNRLRTSLDAFQAPPIRWRAAELVLFESVLAGAGPSYQAHLRAALTEPA